MTVTRLEGLQRTSTSQGASDLRPWEQLAVMGLDGLRE
jgi:hypothetical protein